MDEAIKIKIKTGEDFSETNPDSEAIKWQFEENPISPSNELLWALAILGLAITVFSIMLKNYLLIVIVILTTFIIYILKNRASEYHNFKIDNEGLHIDEKIHPYENFESFWIFPDKEIAFRNKGRFMPLLIVPFNRKDELAIKRILSGYLPESEEEESFFDLLRKKFF